MLGPIAGGLIVGYLHWRVIFFINVPVGLLGLYLVYRLLPDYRKEHSHPLDTVGLILFGSGIGLLSVSYTHLDVYKRQSLETALVFNKSL